MYTMCHTSPNLSNCMESSHIQTLTAHPIAQVIIRATHNTLDHWSLNHNVTVHLSFITLYNYISAKKHNIYKQAICTCLPPGLNDTIKLVLGNKCSTCQHAAHVPPLTIYQACRYFSHTVLFKLHLIHSLFGKHTPGSLHQVEEKKAIQDPMECYTGKNLLHLHTATPIKQTYLPGSSFSSVCMSTGTQSTHAINTVLLCM